jgi:hypothetical protein
MYAHMNKEKNKVIYTLPPKNNKWKMKSKIEAPDIFSVFN